MEGMTIIEYAFPFRIDQEHWLLLWDLEPLAQPLQQRRAHFLV